MKSTSIRPIDLGADSSGPLVRISPDSTYPPPSFFGMSPAPSIRPLTEDELTRFEASLDGVSALCIPTPRTREEESRLVQSFLNGLKKLLSKNDNWTFWQQLVLSLEECVRCQACADSCPIYLASGRQEIYRPSFRSEVLRRIVNKYLRKVGGAFSRLAGNDIELNPRTVLRLAELSYRCSMCRRCAQACPMGVDNALITRELRKLFSQEMGIAPRELHELGTVVQLRGGNGRSATSPGPLTTLIESMEKDIEGRIGRKLQIPVDRVGADALFIHSAGYDISALESPEAFAIIFDRGGVNWTLSSELGYQGTNFGVWYDDIQFARVAVRQSEIARRLKVNRILVGECGHAYKGLAVIADRILTGEANIPRETCLPLLEDLVCNGKLELDASRNNFPVTLHDPCNIVRQMGIVEPQRRILRRICPQFREMEPHGVNNYCCGGGSGFSIMSGTNFSDWRASIAGRMKLKQIIETFSDVLSPEVPKYVCAPCFTCKSQMRDLFSRFNVWEKYRILYGGLVELIMNAMVDVRGPTVKWEWH